MNGKRHTWQVIVDSIRKIMELSHSIIIIRSEVYLCWYSV